MSGSEGYCAECGAPIITDRIRVKEKWMCGECSYQKMKRPDGCGAAWPVIMVFLFFVAAIILLILGRMP